MSKSSNVFSTGQGGGVFEMNVQTAFLINMLIDHRYPGLPKGKAKLIRFQAGTPPYNFETDDIFVELISDSGTRHKLLVQVKHNLSFTEKDETFAQVIEDAWGDFNSGNFDPNHNQFLVVKGNFSSNEYNHLVKILDWTKYKSSYEDFYGELKISKQKIKVFDAFKTQLKKANRGKELSKEQLWTFLKCFNIVAFDFDLENSVNKSNYLTLINKSKKSDSTAEDIWNKIYEYVSRGNSKGASINLENIPKSIRENFTTKSKIGFHVNFNGIPLSYDYFHFHSKLIKSYTEEVCRFRVVIGNRSSDLLILDRLGVKTNQHSNIESRILRQHSVQGRFVPEKFKFSPIPIAGKENSILNEDELFSVKPNESEVIIIELDRNTIGGYYEILIFGEGNLGSERIKLESELLSLMVRKRTDDRLMLETMKFYDSPVEDILQLGNDKWGRLKSEERKDKYLLYLGRTIVETKSDIPKGGNWKIKGVKKLDKKGADFSVSAQAKSKVFLDLKITVNEPLF